MVGIMNNSIIKYTALIALGVIGLSISCKNPWMEKAVEPIFRGSYELNLFATDLNPAVNGSSIIYTRLSQFGTPADGKEILLTWRVKGGSMQPKPAGSYITDSEGNIPGFTFNQSFISALESNLTVTVTAVFGKFSKSIDIQFGFPLPPGVIAITDSIPPTTYTWYDANDYCTLIGGRLPKVGGVDSFNPGLLAPTTLIEGFGYYSDPWTYDFYEDFWTGTWDAVPPNVLFVTDTSGNIDVFSGSVSSYSATRILCVP